MQRLSSINQLRMAILLSVFTLYTLGLSAQSDDDSVKGIRPPEPSERFRILTASETHSHHETLFEEIQEKLEISKFKQEHKDVIAEAFSKVMSGVPIGSYRRTSVTEQTGIDRDEHSTSFVVSEDGFLQRSDSESKSFFADSSTPFYLTHEAVFNFEKGRVYRQNETEITFRFVMEREFVMTNSPLEFLDNLQSLKHTRWALELTIDRDESILKRVSFFLDRPIRKMFVFALKTLSFTSDLEYIEDCGCMAVTQESIEIGGSALFVGSINRRSTDRYSDFECEQPLRYLLPVGHRFDGVDIRY